MSRMYRVLLLTTLFSLSMLTSIYAQEATNSSPEKLRIGAFEGGLSLLITTPQGDFKDNTDEVGVGLGVDLGYVFPHTPLVIGGTFSYATYGSETANVPFSSTVGSLVNVDVTTSNNLALGHLFLRLQPQGGVFRPYAEGLVGFNYFWTETTVESERNTEEIAGSTNLDDFVFSYGAGGGLMFRVWKGETDEPGQGMEVLIDLKLRYLLGGEAQYYAFDDSNSPIIEDENGAPALDESKVLDSATDMLNFGIGVTVRL
ncbi:MAG: hypothetical protein C0600_04150 [Ignavibacteria bacterium]|nr:MAG: hypothetical protein C0600_04150 [Ignavibacteria bacterium]